MLSSFYTSALQNERHHSDNPVAIDQQLKMRTVESMRALLGKGAHRLKVDAPVLFTELEGVGTTHSITRNQHAIHQVIGRYENQKITPGAHSGLILNPGALDLRLFFNKFGDIFSLEEPHSAGSQYRIHFYDVQGNIAHEVHCIDETDKIAWLALIKKYATATDAPSHPSAPASHQPLIQKTFEPSDELIREIETQWRAMDDVHQFFKLLNQYDVTRTQLFNAVRNTDLARKVENTALTSLFKAASEEQNRIMIFVSNLACFQVFTGVIQSLIVKPQHYWITAYNPSFTLHLNIDAIAESWITRKNTKDGFVTSLELFDENGVQIAQLFGQRAEGEHEQKQWRRQTFSLLTAFP